MRSASDFLIEDGVLEHCGSLTDVVISEGVASIGKWAFLDCGSLTDITIPASVASIGDRAFFQTNVTIHDPAGSYAALYAKEIQLPCAAE